MICCETTRAVLSNGALHFGADIPVDQRLIWPPYQSEWPFIPDEETLDALVAQRDQPVRVGMGLARALRMVAKVSNGGRLRHLCDWHPGTR